MMKAFLLSTIAVAVLALPASANQISAFSQTSQSNTLTATANGGNTQTSLSIVDASVNVSQLFGFVNGVSGDFSLSATSNDAAQTVLGLAVQHYDGTFCITSGPGCSGINYLSGTYSDAAVGALGGPGLVVNVNNPPDALLLTSSVIPAADLVPPNTFNLGFSNLGALAICGTTLCSFTASFAGTVSANTAAVPEPSSMLPFAVGGAALGMLGMVRRRRQ
jgi:hypothetical protein